MKKALIIIDPQKGFLNKRTIPVVKEIKKYLEKNQTNYNLVMFTQYLNHSKSNFVKNLDWHGFMKPEETDIADELLLFVNKSNLFKKYTYGSFVDNKVLNYLKKHKIEQVFLAGFDTENCVLTFARDAFDRGFSVVVMKKLCASSSRPKLHDAALDIIKNNIGELK